MKALELKVPPVAVFLLFALIMWAAARVLPAFSFDLPFREYIASAIGVLGILAGVAGVIEFRRAETTVNPMKPETASSVVSSGIYRHSRNPMYLGLLLMLSGWAVFLASFLAIVLLPLFVLYMNRFQIIPEERHLLSKFEAEYAEYTMRTRRWL